MKTLDIALKDMLRSLRSTFGVGMMIVVPLVMTGLIYFAFGGMSQGRIELPVLKVGIVNQDAAVQGYPPLGETLAGMFNDENVSNWLVSQAFADPVSARTALDKGEIGMLVIIPQDFSNALLSGSAQPEVQLIQDPTLSIGPVVVKNMVGSFIDGIHGAQITLQVAEERHTALGASLDAAGQQALAQQFQAWFVDFQSTLYHSDQAAVLIQSPQASRAVQAPGSMQKMLALVVAGQLIFFAFYTGAYSMLSILKEDEEGTLARLFTTPTSHTAILAGKFLSVVLTVTVQSCVLIFASILIFKIAWGNLAAAGLALLGQVLAASSLGILLISLMKSSRQAGPVMGGALACLGMLGGLFTASFAGASNIFQNTALFTPNGWVLQSWKLSMDGASPAAMLPSLVVLIAMSAAMFLVGAAIFRRRFAA